MRTALLVLAALALLTGVAFAIRFTILARLSQERLGRSLSTDAGGKPLAACPERPGCARRQIPLTELTEAMHRRLVAALEAEPGGRIVASHPAYVRAEARTRLFGFVDDVEVRFDPAAGRLELRSASRVGVSDMGANARRLERLVRAITASG